MRNLIFAIQFLTRLPVPMRGATGPDALAASAKWFPLVGLLIGAAVAGGLWLGTCIDPWLDALLALAAWAWITGALHLDGLSDLADALGGAHRDPERFLAIMRDPHAGVFGIVAVWFALSAKLVLLMLLAKQPNGWMAAWLIPAWARLGPLIWAQTLPPLGGGMGQRFGQAPQTLVWIAWLALLGALAWRFVPALLWAPALLAVWWLFLKLRVRGMNGDCLGAGIEVVEVLALGIVAIVSSTQLAA
jgi:adenosylcobinamide-GDP ribazoletransferase